MITDFYGYTGGNGDETNVPKVTILPTLGTHAPMTQEQIKIMYGDEVSQKLAGSKGWNDAAIVPIKSDLFFQLASKEPSPFVVHDWRNDVETIGYVPSEMVILMDCPFVHTVDRKSMIF